MVAQCVARDQYVSVLGARLSLPYISYLYRTCLSLRLRSDVGYVCCITGCGMQWVSAPVHVHQLRGWLCCLYSAAWQGALKYNFLNVWCPCMHACGAHIPSLGWALDSEWTLHWSAQCLASTHAGRFMLAPACARCTQETICPLGIRHADTCRPTFFRGG